MATNTRGLQEQDLISVFSNVGGNVVFSQKDSDDPFTAEDQVRSMSAELMQAIANGGNVKVTEADLTVGHRMFEQWHEDRTQKIRWPNQYFGFVAWKPKSSKV